MRPRRERAIAVAVCCAALAAARAQAVPLLRADGGTGVPGGTVAAVVALAGDPTGEAVAATFRLAFPSPPLAADARACGLAERLAGTHRLTAADGQPGALDLTIAPLAGTPPLGDGALTTCTLAIALGAPAGTAALELVTVAVTDAASGPLAVDTAGGAVRIDAPLPTPTTSATATITLTPTIPPPTDTPTVTPTPTIFRPTVLADTFGGCAIGPSAPAGALPLPAGALALLAWRRWRGRGVQHDQGPLSSSRGRSRTSSSAVKSRRCFSRRA